MRPWPGVLPIIGYQSPIAGATWHAGVSENSHRKRVMLNGEPVPSAFAASDAEGWVLCRPPAELQPVKPNAESAPLGMAYLIDPLAAPIRLTGTVRIVSDRSDRP